MTAALRERTSQVAATAAVACSIATVAVAGAAVVVVADWGRVGACGLAVRAWRRHRTVCCCHVAT